MPVSAQDPVTWGSSFSVITNKLTNQIEDVPFLNCLVLLLRQGLMAADQSNTGQNIFKALTLSEKQKKIL